MDVSNNDGRIRLEQISELLARWLGELDISDISFTENSSPEHDPYSRYTVAYEAIFQPSDLNKARIELWATIDGSIAIGLETKSRIAERLGKKATRGKVFAAGHEPYPVTKHGLLALLTMVREGRIAIAATWLPFFGLVRTKAVLLSETDKYLSAHSYDIKSWLKVVENFERDAFSRVLMFNRW